MAIPRYTRRTLYKFTNPDGSPTIAHMKPRWEIPALNDDGTETPGRWRSVRGELVPCLNGLHLAGPNDLHHWIGSTLWEAEVYDGIDTHGRPMIVESQHKLVCRKARLVRKVSLWDAREKRRFASVCFEEAYNLAMAHITDDGLRDHPVVDLLKADATYLRQIADTWHDPGDELWRWLCNNRYTETRRLFDDTRPNSWQLQILKEVQHIADGIHYLLLRSRLLLYESDNIYPSPYLCYIRVLRAVNAKGAEGGRGSHAARAEESTAITGFFPDLIRRQQAAWLRDGLMRAAGNTPFDPDALDEAAGRLA